MGSRAVDLDEHRLALLAAKGDVVSGRAAASWALFTYEKSNHLKLLDSGAGGPDELAKRFQSGSIMYGLCRLPDSARGQQHIVLINWVGEEVSDQRCQACAGHLPDIRMFFKEANLVVKASRAEEVTQEGLMCKLSLAAPPSGGLTKKEPLRDPEELVGTNYKKTNPALEILHTKRNSFWAQAEREEEERREEERRRAQEERRRWERQRMEEERRQAAERERRIQEKEQLIQEQRKLQAQREAEERREEESRRQQRAKALSEAGPQSPTSEKAAMREAPALALQRSHNRWDGFQQRERSGSASEWPSSPGGQPGVPRRPFQRYQRSLTESAYIFQRPDPPRSPSSSGFLPSGSPSGAAPLPSPRQTKPPPPISPKPGPGAPLPIPAPERRAPPTPAAVPPEAGTLPPPSLMATGSTPGSSPSAAAVATSSPLAEGGLQALPLLSAPGGGEGLPSSASSPELGPPSSSVDTGAPSSPPGPCRASAPPLGSPPHSPADPPQTGPTLPGELAACSPLGACHEGALPHMGTPGPSPQGPDHCGGPSQGEGEGGQPGSSPVASSPTNGFTQEEGPATDDPSAPVLSQAELVPSSGHNGVGATEEGKRPLGHELGMGGQGDSPAGDTLPGAACGADPGAEERTQNGDKPTSVERRGHARDPGLQVAEA